MLNKYIKKAEKIILDALIGKANCTVIVSIDEDNLNIDYFEKALKSDIVQKALKRRNIEIKFEIVNVTEEIKNEILDYISITSDGVTDISFECHPNILPIYQKVLNLPEVKKACLERNITPHIIEIEFFRSIKAIANYDDVKSRNNFL